MDWIIEQLSKYDLKRVFIGFSNHALKDKNLNIEDIENAIETIRLGKIFPEKSNKYRNTICFKRYFPNNITYLVVVGLYEDFLRIVTVIKIRGRI